MKYILMIQVPRGTGDYQSKDWTAEERDANMAHMHQLNEELQSAGELVGVEALRPPSNARVVRSNEDGAPLVTDGPFPESKEFLAGYWIVDVASEQRAYEIAARASAVPGRDGKPLNMPIEVREVMEIAAPRKRLTSS